MWPYLLGALAVIGIVFLSLQQVTVFEYQRGVLYRRGHFKGVLGPGNYWIFPRFTAIAMMDIRPTYVSVPSQELSTSDGASVKISIAAQYQVTDPDAAMNKVAGYQGAVYTHLQLALRELVAAETVDSLLAARTALGKRLHDAAAPKISPLGVTLLEAEIKDVMVSADLKRAFAQVLKAKQEGLAALERARGETAALRHLANAAGMLEQRPALMQLRLLQVLGQGTGNTVVMGMNGAGTVLPLPTSKAGAPPPPPPAGEADA